MSVASVSIASVIYVRMVHYLRQFSFSREPSLVPLVAVFGSWRFRKNIRVGRRRKAKRTLLRQRWFSIVGSWNQGVKCQFQLRKRRRSVEIDRPPRLNQRFSSPTKGGIVEELRGILTRVRFDPCITEIPTCAFGCCSNLIEVKLNEGLEIVGIGAFCGCAALRCGRVVRRTSV